MDRNSDELTTLREKIDAIDDEIEKLFYERMEISEGIAICKTAFDMPIFDDNREDEKLKRIAEASTLDIRDFNMNLYRTLADASKKRQIEVTSGKRYALIGKGISHSLSKEVHRMLGTVNYDLINAENVTEIEKILRDDRYAGFNVTSPYKSKIIRYLDEISDVARELNAVNTIIRKSDGTLVGTNTDVFGFMELAKITKPFGRKVMVLGSGGGASAVCSGMKKLGASEITVVSRHPDTAGRHFRELSTRVISYKDIPEFGDADIIVNATNVGMYPHNGTSPFIKAGVKLPGLDKAEWAVDIIYNPYRTRFLLNYKDLGKKTVSGLPMLVWQAIKAEELWGNIADDIDKRSLAKIVLTKCLTSQLNVSFVGMPGSGKSSISRRLAIKMGREFIDIDRVAEADMGMKVSDVITDEKLGEEYFRNIETGVLARECKEDGRVIATGGGSVLRKINRNCIRENSIVIYMKRPLRLITTKNRPISIREGVQNIYNSRAGLYQRTADIILFNERRFGGVRQGGNNKSYIQDINVFALELKELFEKKIEEIVRLMIDE